MGVVQIKPRWNHEDGVVVMEMQPVGTAEYDNIGKLDKEPTSKSRFFVVFGCLIGGSGQVEVIGI
ncbi:hypothetical protein ANAEL_05534 [Anaerolineales bacterium]|nr:hypothetical protein ANAEL_05534 [Anaerolineales bacterium]